MKHTDGKLMLRVKFNSGISSAGVILEPSECIELGAITFNALPVVQRGGSEHLMSTKGCDFFAMYIVIRLPNRNTHRGF
jgi:hypothetical protein